jgi:hypothetical protein
VIRQTDVFPDITKRTELRGRKGAVERTCTNAMAMLTFCPGALPAQSGPSPALLASPERTSPASKVARKWTRHRKEGIVFDPVLAVSGEYHGKAALRRLSARSVQQTVRAGRSRLSAAAPTACPDRLCRRQLEAVR